METITNDSSASVQSKPGRSVSGAGNEAVQASLKALAKARQAQKRRTRRDRLLASMCAVLAFAAAWGIGTRFVKQRQPIVASSPKVEPVVVAAAPSAPVAPAQPELVVPEVAAQPQPAANPVVEEPTTTVAVEPPATCAAASKTLPSKQVIAICTKAFEAQPSAAAALIVAKEIYRHGQIKEAGMWAEKALELDAELPEAHVIVAYAAEHEGNVDTAASAYRQYLALAPRGWHARKARQGLRRLQ